MGQGKGTKIGTGYIQIMPETKNFWSSIRSEMSGQGSDAGSKFASAFSKGLTAAGVAVAAATAAVGAFAKSAVSAGMDFDSSMSRVAATMGTTVDEISELRDFAQEMGRTTAFSATEAADALNYMALAGYDAQTSMAMLPNVLNLAAAGGIDLAYASDMVTDASSALGLSIDDTTAMVDQMAAASSKSNTSVQQLGEAILKIGATARTIKGGTQELSTILGVLADNGIKGAEGGTHLRNIMLSLQQAAVDGAVDFGSFNVELYDSDGNMRSLIDVIGDMQDGLSGMTQESKDAIVSGVFNKTDLASVNALLGTSKDRFNELSGAIGDAAGAAQKMADTQLDNLSGDVTLFKSALEGAKIALSDQLTPTLREFVQFGTDAVSDITKAFKEDGLSGAINTLGEYLDKGMNLISDSLPGFISTSVQLLVKLAAAVATHIPDIVAGIATGLIDGIAELITGHATGWFSVSEEFSQMVDDMAARVDSLTSAISSANDAYNDTVQAADTNAQAATRLKDKIFELIGAEEQTAGSKALIKAMVDELNGIVPGLGLEYDENRNSLNLLNEEIEANIENMRRQAETAALQEFYTQSMRNQIQAQKDLEDAYSSLSIVMDSYGLSVNDGIEIMRLWQNDAFANIDILTQYGLSLGDMMSLHSDLLPSYENFIQAIGNEKKATNDAAWAYEKWTEAVSASSAATELVIEGMNSRWQAVFGEEMPAALQEAVEASSQAGVSIPAELAEGILAGEYEVDSAMLDLNALVEFNTAVESATAAGSDITASQAASLLAGMGSVRGAIDALNAIVKFNDAIKTSKKGGVDISAGLYEGIMNQSGLAKVYNAASSAGKKAIDGIRAGSDSHSPSVAANAAGQDVLQGLYNGLNNGYMHSSIFNSMWSLGTSIISRVKAAMGVKSPSRYAREIGMFFDEGLALGINNGASGVIDAAGGLAEAVVEEAGMTLAEVDSAARMGYELDGSISSEISGSVAAEVEDVRFEKGTYRMLALMEQISASLERLSRMQMVTDTGVLAGELADEMSSIFGSMKLREGRG